MDKLTVYNRALSLIAAAPYQPQTGVQHPCDLWFPHALRKANERGDWSFARRRITLAEETSGDYPNSSTFSLPADCLKIRNVYYPGTRTKTARRETYGRTLVTDISPTIDLDYTTNIVATMQELPDAEPTFCQAVIYYLAAYIAPEINGSNSSDHDLNIQRAEKEIQDALWLDKKQTESNDQSPLPSIFARRTW